jgi:16S rRNA (guanine527-N7)-methyltransferase
VSTADAEALRLIQDADELGVTLAVPQAAALLRLLDELSSWNRAYNLSAISAREAMIQAHLLDSLSTLPDLAGERIADVAPGPAFRGCRWQWRRLSAISP